MDPVAAFAAHLAGLADVELEVETVTSTENTSRKRRRVAPQGATPPSPPSPVLSGSVDPVEAEGSGDGMQGTVTPPFRRGRLSFSLLAPGSASSPPPPPPPLLPPPGLRNRTSSTGRAGITYATAAAPRPTRVPPDFEAGTILGGSQRPGREATAEMQDVAHLSLLDADASPPAATSTPKRRGDSPPGGGAALSPSAVLSPPSWERERAPAAAATHSLPASVSSTSLFGASLRPRSTFRAAAPIASSGDGKPEQEPVSWRRDPSRTYGQQRARVRRSATPLGPTAVGLLAKVAAPQEERPGQARRRARRPRAGKAEPEGEGAGASGSTAAESDDHLASLRRHFADIGSSSLQESTAVQWVTTDARHGEAGLRLPSLEQVAAADAQLAEDFQAYSAELEGMGVEAPSLGILAAIPKHFGFLFS